MGQGLSLHRELLPDDYAAALQKLTDRVEPFSAAAVQAEIEASFGRPVGELFDSPQLAPQGPLLAAHLVDAYLRQLIVEGVFHGDPHPGNLFVLADGRICFHDFGLIGYLDRSTRLNLVAFMLAFVRQDSDWLLDAYLDLGMLAAAADRAALRGGIEALMQDYAGKPLCDW